VDNAEADAARCAVVGGLAVAVLLEEASIALLGAVGFLLGTGQTLVDTGTHSILPALVSRDPERLERANGRLVGTQVVTRELAGPPAGGFRFSLSPGSRSRSTRSWSRPARRWSPPSAATSARPPRTSGPGRPRTTLRTEIAQGLRWLAAHQGCGRRPPWCRSSTSWPPAAAP
jgi:hypothetical protein